MARLSARKKLAFASATVVALLGLLELAARAAEGLLAARDRPDDRAAVVDPFRPLRYDLAPGSELPTNGAVARINADGLRGASPDRPRRRARVLCLGDSCTFGYAPDVDDASTYPAALGHRLDPARFEVLNGGRPGFGSLDCLGFFVYRAVEFEPDYVVVLAGWNDYAHSHGVVDRPARGRPLRALDGLALVRLGRRAAARLLGPGRPAFDPARERDRLGRLAFRDDPFSQADFARTGRVIADLVRLCRAHGAAPILVTYPNFARPGWAGVDSLSDEELRIMASALADLPPSPRAWRAYIERTNDLIRDVAASQGVPLVDGDSLRDPRLFSDLIHMNAEGSARLADLVAPAVRRASEGRRPSPAESGPSRP
jgi:lysophospholipase L1-like esterase